jgi:hypothetical protein
VKPENRRGTGGKFRLDAEGKVHQFQELFVTPQMPEIEARQKGDELFHELIQTQNINKFRENRSYIEWPDGRLRYDTTNYDWTYGQ